MPRDQKFLMTSERWWYYERIHLRCMELYQITRQEIKVWYTRFNNQRGRARKSNIQFLLGFEEWIKIWFESGHAHERGPHRGQYVMARFGDEGPYAIGNVKIITIEQNAAERKPGNMGKYPRTEEHNRRISETRIARGIKATNLDELHEGNRGNRYRSGKLHSPETKIKMSLSHEEQWARLKAEGYKRSPETRAKISRAAKLRKRVNGKFG